VTAKQINQNITRHLSRQERIQLDRQDRWENEVNKFGGASDPITLTTFKRSARMSRDTLDSLYEHNALAKRIVNIPADDSTREWIKLTHETSPDKAQFIEEEITRLKVQSRVWEAVVQGRLYGGNLLVLGAFDGREVNEPLGVVRKIEFMHNVDRFLVFPQTFYNDPRDMKYGEVETYLVHRIHLQGTQTSVVHESRVIRFEGEYLSQLNRLRNYGWMNPVLQHVWEGLRNYGVSNQAGSAVLQDFVTKKLKISNLQDLLADDEGFDMILKRIQLIASGMAINNVAAYGADEDMDKMGTPITGLAELMEKFEDQVSSDADIPKTRLFKSKAGALGGDQAESDLRIHYDNISAFQENELRPQIQRIIDVLGAQKGYEPGEVTFEYNPLWQISEVEEADVRLKTAQSDQIYITTGVVEPEEVAISRFGGDGVDTSDMNIDVDRREKYLVELSKTPIETDEGDPGTADDPEDKDLNPDADPQKTEA